VVIPELPEVETIVRDIRPHVIGRLITGMVVKGRAQTNILKTDADSFYQGVILQTIQTVIRKGKYIIMPLSNDNVLVMHLGMTGQLLLHEIPDSVNLEEHLDRVDKHTHVILELMDQGDDHLSDIELHFRDPRMFGKIWLVENAEDINNLGVPGLRDLGPDALGIELEDFKKIMRNKKTVKSNLLDQSRLAGVGNIYADEACFAAKVHPAVKGIDLSPEQLMKLWFAVKSVLKEGIRSRGSSISNYTSVDGSKGSFQDHHRVYGRFGRKCVECASFICRTKVAGRSTHFCPSCQITDDEDAF